MLFSFETLFRKLAIHQIATSAFKMKTFGQENFGESLARDLPNLPRFSSKILYHVVCLTV